MRSGLPALQALLPLIVAVTILQPPAIAQQGDVCFSIYSRHNVFLQCSSETSHGQFSSTASLDTSIPFPLLYNTTNPTYIRVAVAKDPSSSLACFIFKVDLNLSSLCLQISPNLAWDSAVTTATGRSWSSPMPVIDVAVAVSNCTIVFAYVPADSPVQIISYFEGLNQTKLEYPYGSLSVSVGAAPPCNTSLLLTSYGPSPVSGPTLNNQTHTASAYPAPFVSANYSDIVRIAPSPSGNRVIFFYGSSQVLVAETDQFVLHSGVLAAGSASFSLDPVWSLAPEWLVPRGTVTTLHDAEIFFPTPALACLALSARRQLGLNVTFDLQLRCSLPHINGTWTDCLYSDVALARSHDSAYLSLAAVSPCFQKVLRIYLVAMATGTTRNQIASRFHLGIVPVRVETVSGLDSAAFFHLLQDATGRVVIARSDFLATIVQDWTFPLPTAAAHLFPSPYLLPCVILVDWSGHLTTFCRALSGWNSAGLSYSQAIPSPDGAAITATSTSDSGLQDLHLHPIRRPLLCFSAFGSISASASNAFCRTEGGKVLWSALPLLQPPSKTDFALSPSRYTSMAASMFSNSAVVSIFLANSHESRSLSLPLGIPSEAIMDIAVATSDHFGCVAVVKPTQNVVLCFYTDQLGFPASTPSLFSEFHSLSRIAITVEATTFCYAGVTTLVDPPHLVHNCGDIELNGQVNFRRLFTATPVPGLTDASSIRLAIERIDSIGLHCAAVSTSAGPFSTTASRVSHQISCSNNKTSSVNASTWLGWDINSFKIIAATRIGFICVGYSYKLSDIQFVGQFVSRIECVGPLDSFIPYQSPDGPVLFDYDMTPDGRWCVAEADSANITFYCGIIGTSSWNSPPRRRDISSSLPLKSVQAVLSPQDDFFCALLVSEGSPSQTVICITLEQLIPSPASFINTPPLPYRRGAFTISDGGELCVADESIGPSLNTSELRIRCGALSVPFYSQIIWPNETDFEFGTSYTEFRIYKEPILNPRDASLLSPPPQAPTPTPTPTPTPSPTSTASTPITTPTPSPSCVGNLSAPFVCVNGEWIASGPVVVNTSVSYVGNVVINGSLQISAPLLINGGLSVIGTVSLGAGGALTVGAGQASTLGGLILSAPSLITLAPGASITVISCANLSGILQLELPPAARSGSVVPLRYACSSGAFSSIEPALPAGAPSCLAVRLTNVSYSPSQLAVAFTVDDTCGPASLIPGLSFEASLGVVIGVGVVGLAVVVGAGLMAVPQTRRRLFPFRDRTHYSSSSSSFKRGSSLAPPTRPSD